MTFMRVDVATSVYEGEISSDSSVRHSIRFLINFQVSEWLYLVQYGNFEKVGVFLLTMRFVWSCVVNPTIQELVSRP